jgi:hypothetical protein
LVFGTFKTFVIENSDELNQIAELVVTDIIAIQEVVAGYGWSTLVSQNLQ